MLSEEFINNYTSYDKDTKNNKAFSYSEFKIFFNEILKKVYKLKKESIFLTSDNMSEIDNLLIEAIKFKDLFFYCNKKKYFEKFKITIHIFLLKIEVDNIV